MLKCNLFLCFWASLLQSSLSHDPSEIIIICWFSAQEKLWKQFWFFIIFVGTMIYVLVFNRKALLWKSKSIFCFTNPKLLTGAVCMIKYLIYAYLNTWHRKQTLTLSQTWLSSLRTRLVCRCVGGTFVVFCIDPESETCIEFNSLAKH